MEKDSHNPIRISKVTFKDSKLTVFPGLLKKEPEESLHSAFIRKVAAMLKGAPEDMGGYAIVAWSKDGTKTFSSWDSGNLPTQLIPTLAKEILRDEKVYHNLGVSFSGFEVPEETFDEPSDDLLDDEDDT